MLRTFSRNIALSDSIVLFVWMESIKTSRVYRSSFVLTYAFEQFQKHVLTQTEQVVQMWINQEDVFFERDCQYENFWIVS